MRSVPQNIQPVAWTVNEWLAATKLSRTTFYEYIKRDQVKIAKAGKRTLVLTSPADFVASLAA